MPFRKHTKIKERQLLANCIKRARILMLQYTNCLCNERTCVVALSHHRYSECTHCNLKCNACALTAAKQEKLHVKEECLKAKEEAAAT